MCFFCIIYSISVQKLSVYLQLLTIDLIFLYLIIYFLRLHLYILYVFLIHILPFLFSLSCQLGRSVQQGRRKLHKCNVQSSSSLLHTQFPINFSIILQLELLLGELLRMYHIQCKDLDLLQIFLLLVKYIQQGSLLHMLHSLYIYLLFCTPFFHLLFFDK